MSPAARDLRRDAATTQSAADAECRVGADQDQDFAISVDTLLTSCAFRPVGVV